MTLDQDIEYWRKCATDAPTHSAALVAIGVSLGLHMAKTDHANILIENADQIAGYLASCLASGDASKVYKVDSEKWNADVRSALAAVLKVLCADGK